MEDIPRYSYDLIDELDTITPRPEFPLHSLGIAALNDTTIRLAAFAAGQRAVVQMLLDARKEIEEAKLHERAGTDTTYTPVEREDYGLGQVLGPDGEQHQTVASTHVAARLVDAVDGDSGEAPSEGEH